MRGGESDMETQGWAFLVIPPYIVLNFEQGKRFTYLTNNLKLKRRKQTL